MDIAYATQTRNLVFFQKSGVWVFYLPYTTNLMQFFKSFSEGKIPLVYAKPRLNDNKCTLKYIYAGLSGNKVPYMRGKCI